MGSTGTVGRAERNGEDGEALRVADHASPQWRDSGGEHTGQPTRERRTRAAHSGTHAAEERRAAAATSMSGDGGGDGGGGGGGGGGDGRGDGGGGGGGNGGGGEHV